MSHEQYLDEPGDVIQWMVRIDDLEAEARRDAEKAQERQGA